MPAGAVGCAIVTGATLVRGVSTFAAAARLESTFAYSEFIDFKDADGNKLSVAEQKGASYAVGMVNGFLEVLCFQNGNEGVSRGEEK